MNTNILLTGLLALLLFVPLSAQQKRQTSNIDSHASGLLGFQK